MINKLRVKFVLISMIAISLVTFSIFGIILIDNHIRLNNQLDEIINIIINNDGAIPKNEFSQKSNPYITQETRFTTRYFTATLNENSEIEKIYIDNISYVDEDEAEEIINEILKKCKSRGNIENFRYGFSNDKKLVVIVDCTMQNISQKQYAQKASIIVFVGLFVTFLIIYFLSEKAIEPLVTAVHKQKEFISNAGHDLKTPVAIISADVEVLKMQNEEENEFVESIKNQSDRLNVLINTMLNLARLDEREIKPNFTNFSLTDIVKEKVKEMKPLFKDKKVEYFFEDDIKTNADKESVSQLITILLDNSIKYVDENGTIEICVSKQGKNPKFEISNTYKDVKNIDTKKIFDRFYREDKSRNSKKDGHGIGLSMAKSIATMNNGKIFAVKKGQDKISFVVILNSAK